MKTLPENTTWKHYLRTLPDSGASLWEDIQYSVDLARQTDYSDIIITGDMNSDFNTRDGHNLLNFVNSNNMPPFQMNQLE